MKHNKDKEFVSIGGLVIREPGSANEAEQCAELMAGSEPWITLGRSYQDSLRILVDPSKEIYVALAERAICGFIIINMNGSFVGYILLWSDRFYPITFSDWATVKTTIILPAEFKAVRPPPGDHC